jgi:endonuclease/exonuclease/phosphatase family metal-dependent hydrolase
VTFDPYAPYGPVVESSMRIVTWNVWGRYGEWEARQHGIEEALVASAPDIVCLVESWCRAEDTQASRTAARLGFAHHDFVGDWKQEDWISGIGLTSRWPFTLGERRPLRGPDGEGVGEAVSVPVEGERGLIQLFVVILDYPLGASAVRQAQVRQLTAFITETTSQRHPVVVCGDFNSPPESDEIRLLTGLSATPQPGLVFYDAWEMAGDGTAGYTWSNENPLAALAMYPNRRFDYVLSAWPRLGAVGHPVHCQRLGVLPAEKPQLSDHYGVLADLQY